MKESALILRAFENRLRADLV